MESLEMEQEREQIRRTLEVESDLFNLSIDQLLAKYGNSDNAMIFMDEVNKFVDKYTALYFYDSKKDALLTVYSACDQYIQEGQYSQEVKGHYATQKEIFNRVYNGYIEEDEYRNMQIIANSIGEFRENNALTAYPVYRSWGYRWDEERTLCLNNDLDPYNNLNTFYANILAVFDMIMSDEKISPVYMPDYLRGIVFFSNHYPEFMKKLPEEKKEQISNRISEKSIKEIDGLLKKNLYKNAKKLAKYARRSFGRVYKKEKTILGEEEVRNILEVQADLFSMSKEELAEKYANPENAYRFVVGTASLLDTLSFTYFFTKKGDEIMETVRACQGVDPLFESRKHERQYDKALYDIQCFKETFESESLFNHAYCSEIEGQYEGIELSFYGTRVSNLHRIFPKLVRGFDNIVSKKIDNDLDTLYAISYLSRMQTSFYNSLDEETRDEIDTVISRNAINEKCAKMDRCKSAHYRKAASAARKSVGLAKLQELSLTDLFTKIIK